MTSRHRGSEQGCIGHHKPGEIGSTRPRRVKIPRLRSRRASERAHRPGKADYLPILQPRVKPSSIFSSSAKYEYAGRASGFELSVPVKNSRALSDSSLSCDWLAHLRVADQSPEVFGRQWQSVYRDT